MPTRAQTKNNRVLRAQAKGVKRAPRLGARALSKGTPGPAKEQPPSLYERLRRVVGKAKGLPPDAAANHDHYLYGMPRK
jgi:hypothetical protein